jgi:hypothetical protein
MPRVWEAARGACRVPERRRMGYTDRGTDSGSGSSGDRRPQRQRRQRRPTAAVGSTAGTQRPPTAGTPTAPADSSVDENNRLTTDLKRARRPCRREGASLVASRWSHENSSMLQLNWSGGGGAVSCEGMNVHPFSPSCPTWQSRSAHSFPRRKKSVYVCPAVLAGVPTL